MSNALGGVELVRALTDNSVRWNAYEAWELLIKQARQASLLGALAHRLHEGGHCGVIPPQPCAHLVAARVLSTAQCTAVHREVLQLQRALAGLKGKVVLLKGAAYLMADLPAAKGRYFSDIDILVPRPALPQVESALMLAGFATTHLHPYDQRYYRRWMHELPPMHHVKRGTVLDVHHTIVPNTSRIRLDASALLGAAVPLGSAPGFWILAPPDMVLHSATHLFRNEDLTHGLRDLVDIDALLRHFGREGAFWPALVRRASEVDLWRPLYYALRFTTRVLGTPVPKDALAECEHHAPAALTDALMDALLRHALHPDPARASTLWARRALYLRGHWLKMPLPLLAWHLTVKAMRRDPQPA
jgi:hypothetical protein